jgi:hypothetical protein
MAKMTITEKGAATLRRMMLRSMVLPPEFQSKRITYSLTSFNSFDTSSLGGLGQYIYHYWRIESRAMQASARQGHSAGQYRLAPKRRRKSGVLAFPDTFTDPNRRVKVAPLVRAVYRF